MNIKSKDLLAWDIVSIVLETVDPIEKKYLSDVIYSSCNDSSLKDISGAFDAGDMIQYTSQYLFPVVQYVLGIIVPIYLDGFVSLTIDELKKRYKGSSSIQNELNHQVNHTPDEIKDIVLIYCYENKIAKETAETIANAILVKFFLTKK